MSVLIHGGYLYPIFVSHFQILFSIFQLDHVTADTIDCDESLEELDAAVHSVCIQSMHDVVDAKWEIRHGAALAIACILTVVPSRCVEVFS